MRTPDVEILWWEGCPSTEPAVAEVRRALAELGLGGADVRMREVATEGEARDEGFLGSPTILIDGVDPFAPEAAEPIGLSCRVYRRRDGRISPTPDPDELRAALRAAADRTEVSR